MGAMKTYLQEATDLVHNHQSWSIESLTNKFCKNMNCDQGTAIYFLEKAIENEVIHTNVYDFEDNYDDGI